MNIFKKCHFKFKTRPLDINQNVKLLQVQGELYHKSHQPLFAKLLKFSYVIVYNFCLII